MNILLIEPFFTGSHKFWAEGYQQNSTYNLSILSLKGIYWKWRMHGGAVTLAKRYNEHVFKNGYPDLILTTDMLNLPVFVAFSDVKDIPIITYFHENQLTYPWSTQDRDKEKNRDHHYGFINYTTALRSNKILYNSHFHKDSFIYALRKFLKQFPDNNELSTIDDISKKSHVPYLGLDLNRFNHYKIEKNNDLPIILWNHRWEYDKNPNLFFDILKQLKNQQLKFKLVVLGEEFDTEMDVFTQAREQFSDEILQFGFCEKFEDYAQWLWKSDYLLVTSNQDFFGASIMESVYCNTSPILPNKLTYPELFDINSNPDIFYNSVDECIILLQKKIKEWNGFTENYSEIAKTYDWSIIAPKYDSILKSV